jgi:glutamine amidotransferase
MCLAIYKPKGVNISKRYLKNAFDGNPHGCGFCFPRNGKLVVEKFENSFSEFWKAFNPLQGKNKMLIHFRFATHGDKGIGNIHPVLFGKRESYALIHNGILNIKADEPKSDTVTYAERVLSPALERFEFSHPALQYLIETSIGSGNKFVVMRTDGKVAIFNESSGHWHKGAWYSNCGYKTERRWSLSGCVNTYWDKIHGNSPKYYKAKNWDTIKSDYVFDETDFTDLSASYVDPKVESFPDYEGTSNHQLLIER